MITLSSTPLRPVILLLSAFLAASACGLPGEGATSTQTVELTPPPPSDDPPTTLPPYTASLACPGGDCDHDGVSAAQGDCDDLDDEIHPGALERCDGQDNDCDGQSDEVFACEDADTDGFSPAQGDCDDQDPGIHPGAAELCDGDVDNDCDGLIAQAGAYYPDADGDGFGASDIPLVLCNPQDPYYVTLHGDCDDSDDRIHPATDNAAADVCDGLDSDCDGSVDEQGPTLWYRDDDGDCHGAGPPVETCAPEPGWVPAPGDCDDIRSWIHPGAAETCDGLDNDCDGLVDPAGETPVFLDLDGDGYGGEISALACYLGDPDWVSEGGDCDDQSASTHPDGTEACDGEDNDCDAAVDEEGQTSRWRDGDGDGFGAGEAILGCAPGPGWATRDGDCDDAAASAHPGAAEVCDGEDEDCDGAVDEEADAPWYVDADGDGFGDARASGCPAAGGGYSSLGGDCDDARPDIFPGATERCDGVDQNCTGMEDEPGLTRYYSDEDGDGWGGDDHNDGCDANLGATSPFDCDDGDPAVNPGRGEICGDGVDNDCLTATEDACPCASDGSCTPLPEPTPTDRSQTPTPSADGPTASPSPAVDEDQDGYASPEDCDDADAEVNPEAAELCNGRDDDCSGVVDDAPEQLWYADEDGDLFGDLALTALYAGCDHPGWSLRAGDCDDGRADISPAATETCDGEDDDCDGIPDQPFDLDRDGFTTCDLPDNPPDCRPSDPGINACLGSARFGASSFPTGG